MPNPPEISPARCLSPFFTAPQCRRPKMATAPSAFHAPKPSTRAKKRREPHAKAQRRQENKASFTPSASSRLCVRPFPPPPPFCRNTSTFCDIPAEKAPDWSHPAGGCTIVEIGYTRGLMPVRMATGRYGPSQPRRAYVRFCPWGDNHEIDGSLLLQLRDGAPFLV